MKTLKIITSVVICVAMIIFLAGCGSEEGNHDFGEIFETGEGKTSEKIIHTAYVIDKTKYSPAYELEKLLYQDISDTYVTKDCIASVIQADGNSKNVDAFKYDGKDMLNSSSGNEKQKQKRIQSVIECMDCNTIPDDPEINLLSAVKIAVDELNAYDKDSMKRIVIVSSGLSTLAPLDMTDGIGGLDINSIVANLKDNNELCDMTDMTVDLYGIGKVALGFGQDELSGNEVKVLENLYKSIFVESGISEDDIVFHSNNPTGEVDISAREKLPEVSTVSTNGTDNMIETVVIRDEIIPDNFDLRDKVLEFPEDSVLSYYAGTPDFIENDETINNVLTPIVNWLIDYPEESIAIFSGTASCGTKEELEELSYARANAVKSRMIDLGADESRISIYALGYENNPNKCTDTIDGVFIEEEAKKNRVTYITSADGEDAEKFYRALGY